MKLATWLTALALTTSAATAGEITKLGEFDSECTYKFEGRVEPGDASKVAELETFGSFGASLCLNSPGGSLLEGIRIFETIWNKKQMHTRVMNGDTCESACAIAWLGGSLDTGTAAIRFASRSIEPGAVLGFHAPSLDLPDEGTYPAKQVKEAVGVALKSAEGYFKIKLTTQDGVEILNDFLYARILETPGDSMFRITTVAEAVLSNVLVSGVKAQEKIRKADILHLCENVYLMQRGVKVGLPDAASHLQDLRNNVPEGERVAYVAETYWAVRFFCESRAQYICLIRDEDFGRYLDVAPQYNGDLPYINGLAEAPKIRVSLKRVNYWPNTPVEYVWKEIADGSGELVQYIEMPHCALHEGMTPLVNLPRH